MPSPFTTLFVDVGGVLLTHAWSPIERLRAVEHFALDREAAWSNGTTWLMLSTKRANSVGRVS